jgi:hypothetical protein
LAGGLGVMVNLLASFLTYYLQSTGSSQEKRNLIVRTNTLVTHKLRMATQLVSGKTVEEFGDQLSR